MPIRAIAFNNKISFWKSEINGVEINGELRPSNQPRFGKYPKHGDFQAACAGPYSAGKCARTSFGTSAEPVSERMSNQFYSSAYFTSHRIWAALIVVAVAFSERLFTNVRTYFGTVGYAIWALFGSTSRECLITGGAGKYSIPMRYGVADTIGTVPLTSASIGAKAIKVLRVFDREYIKTVFTNSRTHVPIITQPSTESNMAYNKDRAPVQGCP